MPRPLDCALRARSGRDHPELGHLAQHLVAAPLGRLRVADGRVRVGRLGDAGQQRGLADVEVLELLVEVDLRRGLDADRGLAADGAVRDRVQVALEDPLLGVLVLELLGQLRLADLARVGLLVGDVERADELHRDRRAALLVVAVEVVDRGADDALVVDAVVLVEALVLDRDGRVAHDLRDVRALEREVQLVVLDEAERGAVGRVDARVLGDRAGLERRERRGRGGEVHDVADGAEAGDHDEDPQHHEGEEDLAHPRRRLGGGDVSAGRGS